MLLAALLVAPLAAAALAFIASGKDGDAATRLGLVLSLAIAALGLPLVLGPVAPFNLPWFALWGTGATVSISLASDGLSGWLIQLATWLTPLAILGARKQIGERMRDFVVAVLIAEAAIIGALLARDLVLFYVCYEAMLLPVLVILCLYGGDDRRSSALWFFIYTMAGSLGMLVGIWYLAHAVGSTDLARVVQVLTASSTVLDERQSLLLTEGARFWLFVGFVLAFAVKVPLIPLHAWQARTYAECPGALMVILGGVMSKLGVYGFLRFVIPMFPGLSAEHANLFITLGVIGTVGGALVAIAQDDAKRMLAYSSLSHLGLVMAGIFTFQTAALNGAAVQMVAHGLSTAALFLLVGAVEARSASYGLEDFGALVRRAPVLAVLFVISALASAALPGTANFVGEFALLLGLFQGQGIWVTAIAGVSVILGVVYLLILIQRWFFGKERSGAPVIADLGAGEALAVIPLLIASFWLGFAPGVVLTSAGADAAALVAPAKALAADASLHDSDPVAVR